MAEVWTGGVSEIRRVADFTAAFQRSFTPIGLAVGTHVSLYAETAIYQEAVRASSTAGTRAAPQPGGCYFFGRRPHEQHCLACDLPTTALLESET